MYRKEQRRKWYAAIKRFTLHFSPTSYFSTFPFFYFHFVIFSWFVFFASFFFFFFFRALWSDRYCELLWLP